MVAQNKTFPRNKLLDFNKSRFIDNYEIISKFSKSRRIVPLGEGGSGVVYLAKQTLDRENNITIQRAIKLFIYRDDIAKLPSHQSSGQVSASNFKDELINLASLNHENIIKIIEAGFWKASNHNLKIPYLISEFIDGQTLQEALNNDSFKGKLRSNPELSIDLILQLARAVSYLHKREFFHCDIAPKNIFLESGHDNYRLILGDLGVGRSRAGLQHCSVVLVAGTKSYAPKTVNDVMNTSVSTNLFLTLQPLWDVYAFSKTCLDILNVYDKRYLSNKPWLRAIRGILENSTKDLSDNIESLKAAIERNHPVQFTVGQVPELSENYQDTIRMLFPIDYVTTTKRIRKIINHNAFLRLKNVPQLVLASATFPSARHSRYEHSLGAYQVTRKYLLTLLNDEAFLGTFGSEFIELALLCSLLSNISRFPFSSIIHEIRIASKNALFQSLSQSKLLKKVLQKKYNGSSLVEVLKENFPKVEHEKLNSVLAKQLNGFSNPEVRFAHFLINNSIDSRVIDYLRRDSLHLGVSAGDGFDFDELLQHIRFKDNKIVVKSSGISILEEIILERYWMFNRIYWNSPNRSFIAMTREVILLLNKNESFEDELANMILESISEEDLLRQLLKIAKKRRIKRGMIICEYLLEERPRRFKEMVQFNRAEDDSSAINVCNKIVNASIDNILKLQTNIESELRKVFNSIDPIIIIDIPLDSDKSKLGEDLDVITPKNDLVPLHRYSSIVKGAYDGFETHLQRLRVFLDPTAEKILRPRRNEAVRIIRDILLRQF